MPATEKNYKRLPGKKKLFIGFDHTLWAGKDHLLHIYSQRVREEYTRYYYQDIQAIYLRKTPRFKIETAIYGCVTTGFLALALLGFGEVLTYLMAALFGAMLIINLWKGPTCDCHIQTFVRRDKLPSLYRIRTARKALDFLTPLIQEVQGRVTLSMLEEAGEKGLPKEPIPALSQPVIEKKAAGKNRVHPTLFLLLLISGTAAAADISLQHVALPLIWIGATLAAVICVIIALVKQFEVKTAKEIQTLTWISVVFLCIDMILGYGLYMYVLFSHLHAAYNQWEAFRAFAAISPMEKPIIFTVFAFSAAGGLLLGMIGLFLVMRTGNRPRTDLHRSAPPLEPAAASTKS